MNIFQLIKKVLDSEFDKIPGVDPKSKYDQVNKRHVELVHAYGDLTDSTRSPPDYADPVTRFAYIHKYTTCHADIVCDSLGMCDELEALFEGTGWLSASCIGGGPGSDFLGMLKYALRADTEKSLKCFLLDRESAWGDTWSDVEQQTSELPFRISTHFQQLDVTNSSTWSHQVKYRSSQLFTFIYFLSEVYRLRSAAQPFFEQLVQNAACESCFLFVDNDTPEFRAQILEFESRYALRLIKEESRDYRTDTNEDKEDLEPHFSAIRHTPKIKAKIFRAVMVKP